VRGHFIARGDVYWPEDFHTWNMVTAYYNVERIHAYFTRVFDGVAPTELNDLRVLYWAEYRPYSATPVTDNALYLSIVKSLALLPQQNDQLVPMAMNIGVVGHEVAHRVFGFRALGDAGIHPALVGWNLEPFNLLKSIDEGFADFHGWGVTCLEPMGCRSAFLAPSIEDTATAQRRDISRPGNCLDLTTRAALRGFTPTQWVQAPEMYKVGTLWASALYQAANKAGKVEELQKALLASYDDETPRNARQEGGPGLRQLINRTLQAPLDAFTPEAVADVLLAHITDPALKKLACSELLTRLQLKCEAEPPLLCKAIPACPGTSARDTTTCPLLADP
jgi:hypothetical protein